MSAIAVHHATPLLRVRRTAALHQVLRHIAVAHRLVAVHAAAVDTQAAGATQVVAAVAVVHEVVARAVANGQ